MMNKYSFWKKYFSLAGVAGVVLLTSCTKLKSEFSWSPTNPRAGEVVTFLNESTGADDYVWSYGDNMSSTTSSPTHIFYKPGIYTVTLQIVRNKVEKKICTHQITVIDTVPCIAMSADTIWTYTPITFSVNVYNPWRRSLSYHWTLPQDAVVTKWGKDSATVTCYFQHTADAIKVKLALQQGDKAFQDSITKGVKHQPSHSIIYTDNGANKEQFIYRLLDTCIYQTAQDASSVADSLLKSEVYDCYVWEKDTFTIDRVKRLLDESSITGFQVNRPANSLYAFGQNGMWVYSLIGKNKKQLETAAVKTIKVDTKNDLIYWATARGLLVHSLLHMSDFRDWSKPDTLQTSGSITRLSVNNNKH